MEFKYENQIKKYPLSTGGIEALLLESGNISLIHKGIVYLNQLIGNNLEPTASNIYLRVVKNGEVSFTRLIGVGSPSKFVIEGNKAFYIGSFEGVNYEVCFTVVEDTYFFTVNVDVKEDVVAQVFYGMDVAIADLYAVRNNEAYVCQYINHSVYKDELGYTVMSRQNQGVPHYFEQGSLTENIGFSTDGYQFFGREYKLDNTPALLKTGVMPNEIYQYEFAYTVLSSKEISNKKETLVFYGSYIEKVAEVRETPLLKEEVKKLYESLDLTRHEEASCGVEHAVDFSNVVPFNKMSQSEVDRLYPNRLNEEYIDGELMSFFTEDYRYVTLGQKELHVERPTGHILLNTDGRNYEESMASTAWIFGVFNSQVVCGNTSFNKYSSNSRNALNVQKISGQRIFVKIDGEYKLLGVPSIYEIGLNSCKWHYVINGETILVESVVSATLPEVVTTVKSENSHEFLISEFICMAPNEYENPYTYKVDGNKIVFYPDRWSMAGNTYPNLTFTKTLNCPFDVHTDDVFYKDQVSRSESLVTLHVEGSDIEMRISGNTFGKEYNFCSESVAQMKEDYIKFIDKQLNYLNMSIDNEEKERINSFNILLRWYTHNMLVHLTSPHGLEQYSGAAWGTRDVCQGPAEYLLATNNLDMLREIILHVFAQQYKANGNWPQWFMIDKYLNIQQDESHGDIIVWPVRLVALYLDRSHDYEILNELIPYTKQPEHVYSEDKYTLLEHLENTVENIKKNFIPNTHLSSYGGGDWDDTLQPANHSLASNMVSGWTVALTYEAFMNMYNALKGVLDEVANSYLELAEAIKKDYNEYLIKDEIPAGFIYFDKDRIKYIIHPRDEETGMKYRLLPINRGIVSEIFDEEMKDQALRLMREHLTHPDGVRLMDNTVAYHGGINTYFMRAETASNFGREIGLQYCHAHIRHCEALAKVGDADALYKGLLTINPIQMTDVTPNALPRQRNAYFSSSDGDFLNRYEAMERFGDLKTGAVGVKGGWRVYSSGPGIYVYQIVSSLLGIRISGNDVILDPVLPSVLSGLKVDFNICGKLLHFTFLNEGNGVLVNGKEVETARLSAKYRQGGYKVSLDSFKDEDQITVLF